MFTGTMELYLQLLPNSVLNLCSGHSGAERGLQGGKPVELGIPQAVEELNLRINDARV